MQTDTSAFWNGEISDDPDLEGTGIGEKVPREVQNRIGHAQKAFGISILFHAAE